MNAATGAPTRYQHIAFADSEDGQVNFHLSQPEGRRFIGAYVGDEAESSADPAAYTWALMRGESRSA